MREEEGKKTEVKEEGRGKAGGWKERSKGLGRTSSQNFDDGAK